MCDNCSEVVERLRNEAVLTWGQAYFDTQKAEAILHSWREQIIKEKS